MPHYTRYLSLLAALLLVGCSMIPSGMSTDPAPAPSDSVSSTAPVVHERVRLPWFDDDTLNPYSCKTVQNYYLAGLLCDPLVALDSANQPVKRLALDIVSSDHTQYVITLRGSTYFSDGSPLTAADVLYSLTLAQASPRFSGGLGGIVEATANGDSSITVTLAAPDIFFARSLIFPIIKLDTAELPQPVGVGRYTLDAGGSLMVRNNRYYNPVKNVREIVLVGTDSLEEQSYGVMDGTMDLMYSDLQSDLNLGMGLGYRQIPLSNMVYLRVNHNKAWATRAMRQIISGLVRREEIARRVYTGFAAITSIPINPVMAATALTATDLEVSLDKQRAALTAEGWELKEDGTRRKGDVTLSLELIASQESNERLAAAELVAESMRQVGIGVTIVSLPYAEYLARVSSGNYDLCIAETRIAYNMEMEGTILPARAKPKAPAAGEKVPTPTTDDATPVQPTVSTTPVPATGDKTPVQPFSALSTLYSGVKAGTTEQSELENTLRQELPVIPLLFRRGIICFSRDFSANMVATEQDIFYNIVEW